ncbi:MAG TPA: ADP-ribosylglycohydrolase family protein [Clostridiales bacterium]|nr:ADP-ribosylglycohydrolase family protein [Clostridiales bacterium]
MWISMEDYKKRVLGCWMGKNIGGTLGAPFEGHRGIIQMDFYTQELKGVSVPNDDLDLQLVWLSAAEKYGRAVSAAVLGEYWLEHILPDWAEYGYCKNNMRAGIRPPLSGSMRNPDQNSNGAWIRSEIWACLAPGHPDIAAGYAYEDASVDHSREGIHSAVFCASVQSAAFAETDRDRLIDIGLSYIPEDCAVAGAVRLVRTCHREGVEWTETRKRILQAYPGTFFKQWVGEPEMDIPFGEKGDDAPSNVAIFVLGWLYGEGDFGRSLCIAAGCGEDADCTAATLGATLGILGGIGGIPEKWIEPIGQGISTACIHLWNKPETIGQLTDRLLRLTARFLDIGDVWLDGVSGYRMRLSEKEKLFNRAPGRDPFRAHTGFYERYYLSPPHTLRVDAHIFYAQMTYMDGPLVQPGNRRPVRFRLRLFNQTGRPLTITATWRLPEGWTAEQGEQAEMALSCNFYTAKAERVFNILPPERIGLRSELILTLQVSGRPTRVDLPVTLYADAGSSDLDEGYSHARNGAGW